MKWRFVIVIVFFCFGCAELNRPEQLDDIGVLLDDLETIRHDIESINPQELAEITQSFDSLVQIVTEIQPDSIPFDLAVRLDNYKFMAIGASESASQYDGLMNSIEQKYSRVLLLKEDVEYSRGHRDKYADYIKFEKEQIEKLKGRVDTCVMQTKNSISIYNELNASIVQDVLVLRKDTMPN